MFHEKGCEVCAIAVGRLMVWEWCVLLSNPGVLVGEYTTKTVVTGLPANSAMRILLVCLWTRWRALHAREPSISPTPPVAAWASFRHADAVMNVRFSTLQ